MSHLTFKYALKPSVEINNQYLELEPVISLLKEIHITNNLRAAANNQGYSYRKAWNLIQSWEGLFGQTLVHKQWGKGSKLSELSQLLVNVIDKNEQNLSEGLSKANLHANSTLQAILSKPNSLKMIASDSDIINSLRQ